MFITSVPDYPPSFIETHQCQAYNEPEKDRVKNLTGVHKCRSCLSLEANTGQMNLEEVAGIVGNNDHPATKSDHDNTADQRR
jgi:hypothetical protein